MLVLICLGCELFFVLADAIINYGKLTRLGMVRRFFNIAREDSLASWFGTTQTSLAALTLWFIYISARARGYAKWRKMGWLLLALFFSYMAMDDGAQFHERAGSAFRATFENKTGALSPLTRLVTDFPGYAWQILFLPLFGAMGIFMMYFLLKEIRETPVRLLFAGALACFVFAVILDFFEGLDPGDPMNIYTHIRKAYQLRKYTVDHFAKSLEEFLEMAGITFFWASFLYYLSRMPGDVRLRFLK